MTEAGQDTQAPVERAVSPGFVQGWAVEARYGRLPSEFYTAMTPEQVGDAPFLLHANAKAAALIDLDPSAFDDPAFPLVFSGHLPVKDFKPLATVYAGHQFGAYVPQLGDGRALLIAELRNRMGEPWELQLKGAGRTPYSRFGDGRAVLRSCIREYLCSEAMAGLGIPTTRALAIVATREGVQRETLEPGAVMTRLSPSHVRFGHFEFFHHSGNSEAVRLLADHVIAEHFLSLAGRDNIYESWFAEVVRRTAHLIAAWQAAGFAHGVMNTDNMSILGLAIDYGPFGFLDAFDPGLICNHSDDGGRYAFNRQPAIAHWNLRALALALTSLIPEEALRNAINAFEPEFTKEFSARMYAKCGLDTAQAGDAALINDLMALMATNAADYTLTFRRLSRIGEVDGRAAWLSLFPGIALGDARAWLDRYCERISGEDVENRCTAMDLVNPKYVLRNWVAETAIRAVEDQGDVATLDRILRVMQTPFDEHDGDEVFAAPPPEAMRELSVSCSS